MLPIDIKLHQKSKRLELSFTDSRIYSFSYEFLRVHSPSAEVRGHSPSQAVLQLDKVSVGVKEVELVGAYALKITFDDWIFMQDEKVAINRAKMTKFGIRVADLTVVFVKD